VLLNNIKNKNQQLETVGKISMLAKVELPGIDRNEMDSSNLPKCLRQYVPHNKTFSEHLWTTKTQSVQLNLVKEA